MTPRVSRHGALLLELLLALSLGVVVLGAFAAALGASLRWADSLTRRTEALEVVRTIWFVLDGELRSGIPGRDWHVASSETLDLRAFRGLGRVCRSAAGPGDWSVAYRGARLPDPMRDSVLVLGADGGWRAFALDRSNAGLGCDESEEGEIVLRWSWRQDGAPAPVLARVFEHGEYHLSDGALRYRRGAGGRQPLTPERLGAGSGFLWVDDALEIHIEFAGAPSNGSPDAFVWRVAGMEGSSTTGGHQ